MADADNGSHEHDPGTIASDGEWRAHESGPAGKTMAGLLAELGLDMRKVAIERNREIVPRGRYAEIVLEDADAIEIVHFIGGG